MAKKHSYEELEQRILQLENIISGQPTGDFPSLHPGLLNDIIENSGALIVVKDRDGKNILVNRKWEEVTGLPRDKVLGKTDEMLFPPDIARQFRNNDLRAMESGETIEEEETLDTLEGRRHFISNKFPLFDHTGQVIGLCGIITDITPRKQAEEALRFSREKYQSLFRNAQVALFKTRIDGELVEINQRYADMAGYPDIDTCMKEFKPVEAWANPESRLKLVDLLKKNDEVSDYEAEIVRRDGSHAWILFSARLFPEDGVIEGSIVDITERKATEQSLRESEERFKALHNASFGGITIHDKGVILECNKGLSEITGYTTEELIGMDGLLLIAEKSRDLVMGNILSGYEKPYEAFGVRKNGEEYPVRLEARNIPYKGKMVRTVEFRDISESKQAEEERRKLQEQLSQAQKMESVGRLAGGVAHDFNNMLGVILGYTELALESLDDMSPLHTDLKEIHLAATRSMEITKQLLAFARQQTVAPRILNLNHTIESMLKMLQRLIGEDIELIWQPETELWPVRMDPVQIDQVLANLCVNARDAITDVGNIIITTQNIVTHAPRLKGHEGIPPGDFVLLTFRDDGCGMDREVLANLFEPFYTTKGINQGTGLGLATVYGIIKQNQGFITVDSEPGKGTVFRIYLPRQAEFHKAEEQINKHVPLPNARRDEIILLVEDEPAILVMTMTMLQKLGYTVVVAETPGKALEMAREYKGEIHLLITDVIMPKMNGRDLARDLIAIYPDLKCLFMSGYTADVIGHHGVLDEGVQFIQKPFTKQDLAVKVRKVLDHPQQPLPA